MFFKCISYLIFAFLLFTESSWGQNCDFTGLKCISCTDYQKCRTGFSFQKIISCKNGDSCGDNYLKQCQIKLNCFAGNECTQGGIFPDALIDSNYYVCLSDGGTGFVKYDFTCPEGNFFDKSTLTCALRTVTAVDPSTQPPSTDPPFLPPSTEPSSLPPSTEPPTPTKLSSPITTSPMTSTEPPTLICATTGIFPNPSNCKMYYRCSTSLKIFHYICPGNSYFNKNILKCSLRFTPECQEQILKNSTTTLPPITTPASTTFIPSTTPTTTTITTTLAPTTATTTTTTTTTLAPKTTTTASTTYLPSPPTTTSTSVPSPMTSTSLTPLCLASGIIANPSDCKSYYRCSVSGQIFLYVCPGKTYFNEITMRCSLVITPRCERLIQV